jgi:hypothetical protein
MPPARPPSCGAATRRRRAWRPPLKRRPAQTKGGARATARQRGTARGIRQAHPGRWGAMRAAGTRLGHGGRLGARCAVATGGEGVCEAWRRSGRRGHRARQRRRRRHRVLLLVGGQEARLHARQRLRSRRRRESHRAAPPALRTRRATRGHAAPKRRPRGKARTLRAAPLARAAQARSEDGDAISHKRVSAVDFHPVQICHHRSPSCPLISAVWREVC